MIKRIIFDIDNTLIPWKDEYYANIGEKVFAKLSLKYTNKDITDIVDEISSYEESEPYFIKEKLNKALIEKSKLNLPQNFIDILIDYFATCVPESVDKDIEETLNYLSKKYELVALTNWFAKEQEDRLEKVGLNKYIKKVYGTEKIKMKPNKESYIASCGDHKVEECIMVGDSIKKDIEGAIACNMKAIYYNPNKLETKYPNIQKFSDLKEYL